MKSLSTTTIIALMTATLGASAVAPAFAQEAPPPVTETQPAEPAPALRGGPRHGGGFDLLGFNRGSEAVEIALVRLSHATELTDEQQTLFDTLRTDALAAAETFETRIEALRPDPATADADAEPAAPDLSQMLDNHLALAQAQVAALEAVQPAFTAFFDSLTDEQKAELVPQRGEHEPGPGGRPGNGPMGGRTKG